ncbi:hypothetical protein HP550_21530 [Cellulomonas humilata]|uniref:DUF3180 domain-containing protein n=1 Tax=Cellulomonas humilata TaxID=144055 RepID=A0A7Y6A7B1_9CELL|nr:hypothetical protein [Cellulomonas humilata]NUU19834.1 hypothetical protein [Cellulomonas humilata]
MTNPRLIALFTVPAVAFALLVSLVASHEQLWTSWPGTAVRFGGVVIVAVGLYALAARLDRRAPTR